MMFDVTIRCPDCVSMVDANDFFKYLIIAIQDLELEIAYMQHDMNILCRPNESNQLQMYRQCSYLPDLVNDPVFGEFLAYNDISIEEWQGDIEQHLQDLEDCANGDNVISTDIL